jgi:hypothetical protein
VSSAAPPSGRTVVGVSPALPWPLSGWRWWTEPVRAERLAVLRIALALLLLADILLSYLPQLHDYFGPGSLGTPDMFDYLARAPKWNWSLLRGFRDPLLYTAAQAVWLGTTPLILLGLWGRLTAAGRPGPYLILRWSLAAWAGASVWVVFGLWTRVLPTPGPGVANVAAPLASLGWRIPTGMVGVASLFWCLAVWRRVKEEPDDDPWVWRWVLLAWVVSAALAALAVWKVLAGAEGLPFLAWSEERWHGEGDALRAAMIVWVVAVVLLLLGLWTRASAAVAWLLAMSFDNLNWYINNAGDQVRCITLFYLMLSPCGAAWSLDSLLARLRGRRTGPVYVSPWPLRLLFVQMASMYFWNGLYKVIGPDWQQGNSLYFVWCDLTLARFSYAEFPVPLIITRIMTWTVVVWELSFPLLALFRWTRPVALLFGFLFHLGILATLEIGGFAPYMMILYLPLLPWDRWLERRVKAAEPGTVTLPGADGPPVAHEPQAVTADSAVR